MAAPKDRNKLYNQASSTPHQRKYAQQQANPRTAYGREYAKVKGNKESDLLIIEELKYYLNEGDESIIEIGMSPSLKKSGQYEVTAQKYALVRNPGRVWYPSPPVRFYGFPDEVVNYYGISRKLMETKFHFTAPSKVAFPVSHNKRGFLSGNFRNS